MSRYFGDLCAVNRVSLQVPTGTIFGFLGPNGAGKTTTLRLLLGLLELDGGSATVLGYDVATEAEAIREHTGVLLQHDGLYQRLSVYDNLEFFGRIYHLDKVTRQARIRELLEHLGLWERRNDNVAQLSRGLKQRVAIARALLHRPRLVFLDEPSAGLDPMAAVALREDIQSLARKEGTTVFLTTHNLAEAEKVCDIVGVIRKGRLIAVGTPTELRARTGKLSAEIYGRGFNDSVIAAVRSLPQVNSVLLHNDHLQVTLEPDTEIAPLVSLLVREGVEVEEVHKGQSSLEEAFVALMQEEDNEA
ncbi:MAG: ABC transporter ATP-binding protein [Candidatus Zixiibacteriota bacterium]|nr:MAG: ABC transporter ATP-binding protein [candidate division Zixibacteria bacterium]